jgi:ABC-2 type transport system ATP-binding protein
MIEINSITKKYNDYAVIDNVSLSIDCNNICGLVGYNGAGKTTLLKLICGILKPETGFIKIDDELVYDNSELKNKIFLIPDDPYVLPQSSMKAMSRFYRSYYSNWDNSLYYKLVELFNLDENKNISSFSRGMKKQAFIIFAFSVSAKYLLLDETFDGLDPAKRDLLRRLLEQNVKKCGAGVIISSHNIQELENTCNRIIVIREKKICDDIDCTNYSNDSNYSNYNNAINKTHLQKLMEAEMRDQTQDITGIFKTHNKTHANMRH